MRHPTAGFGSTELIPFSASFKADCMNFSSCAFMTSPLPGEDLIELLLVDDLHPQFPGLLQFAAGVRTGQDIMSLLAYAA